MDDAALRINQTCGVTGRNKESGAALPIFILQTLGVFNRTWRPRRTAAAARNPAAVEIVAALPRASAVPAAEKQHQAANRDGPDAGPNRDADPLLVLD